MVSLYKVKSFDSSGAFFFSMILFIITLTYKEGAKQPNIQIRGGNPLELFSCCYSLTITDKAITITWSESKVKNHPDHVLSIGMHRLRQYCSLEAMIWKLLWYWACSEMKWLYNKGLEFWAGEAWLCPNSCMAL